MVFSLKLDAVGRVELTTIVRMETHPELRQTAYNAFKSSKIEQKMALAGVLIASTAINTIANLDDKNHDTKPGSRRTDAFNLPY
jgi:hypothetical protein